MNAFAPIFAEIEKHLDDALRHAASLDPSTDGQAIIAQINVARGYLASARTVAQIAEVFDRTRPRFPDLGSCEGHPLPQPGMENA